MARSILYKFRAYTVDVEKGELRRQMEGASKVELVHLRSQAWALLLFLIENRSRVVSKEDAWKQMPRSQKIEDDESGYNAATVDQALRDLRVALQDDGETYIKRVRNNQLRFVCTVESVGGEGPSNQLVDLKETVLSRWRLRTYLFIIGGGLCLSGAGVSMRWVQSSNTYVGATIRSFDNVQVSYKDSQTEYISPMCGCFKEQSSDAWRGVAFASRNLTLERHGTKPLTAFYISAAYPESINWKPSAFLFDTIGFEKSFKSDVETFQPASALRSGAGTAASEFTTYQRLTNELYILIITDKVLHITQLGNAPFGAWIPVANSKVTVHQRASFFMPTSLVLRDEYPPFDPGVDYFRDPQEYMELPILDVLGSQTVIWTEDDSAWLFTNNRVLRRGDGDHKTRSVIGAVVFPPFSTRVALMPTGLDARDHWISEFKGAPWRPGRVWFLDKRDLGVADLRIERTEGDLAEFEKAYARIRSQDTIASNVVRTRKIYTDEGLDKATMRFRYPPAPPMKGFNLFGPMSFLHFENATGSLAVGSKMGDVQAPSTIEFRDVKGFKASGGVITVPVQIRDEDTDAKLRFSGVSKVSVNGSPVFGESDGSVRSAMESVMICGGIGFAFGGLLLLWLRSTWTSLPQSTACQESKK